MLRTGDSSGTTAAFSGVWTACALACLAQPGRALAHDPAAGSAVYERGDQLVIRTGRGLIANVDDERRDYRFVCNEAMQVADFDAPSVILRSDRQLLLGTSQGMLRVSPDLCEWRSLPAFEGVHVAALARDPTTDRRIYAATGLGLYVSTDEGDSFEPLDDHVLDSLAASPEQPQLLYGTGSMPGAPGHPQVYFARWQADQPMETFEYALDPNEYGIALLGSDARDNGRVFAVAHAYLGTAYPDRFLISTDGAHSWSPLLSANGVAAFETDPTTGAWLVGSADGLLRAGDPGSEAVRIRDTPITCLRALGSRLYLCDGAGAQGGVSISHDAGEHLTSVLRFNQVTGLPDCRPDAPPVASCQTAWSDWQREMPSEPTRELGGEDLDAGQQAARAAPAHAMSAQPEANDETLDAGATHSRSPAATGDAGGVSGRERPGRASSCSAGNPAPGSRSTLAALWLGCGLLARRRRHARRSVGMKRP